MMHTLHTNTIMSLASCHIETSFHVLDVPKPEPTIMTIYIIILVSCYDYCFDPGGNTRASGILLMM